jgi:hypothetical protein
MWRSCSSSKKIAARRLRHDALLFSSFVALLNTNCGTSATDSTIGSDGPDSGHRTRGNGGATSGGATSATAGMTGAGGVADAGGQTAPPAVCNASLAPSEDPCVIDESYGSFVSPYGSDDVGEGTRANPYATIGKAISAAHAASLRVYVCATAGSFKESLVFDATNDGSRLYGGFDCASWHHLQNKLTQIESGTTTGIAVTNLTSGLHLEDFAITASGIPPEGGSSFGAFVTDSTSVVLRRVRLTAGPGAAGKDAVAPAGEAHAGSSGHDGTAACKAESGDNLGGRGIESLCGETARESAGGDGGKGGYGDGDGVDGQQGKLFGGGLPGFGEDADNWTCVFGDGQDGKDAPSPNAPIGAEPLGKLSASGYSPANGEDGADGLPGAGGGGGGGAKAPPSCGNYPPTGASGGSGGGGGCGGEGGKGGKGGGASMALASIHAFVTLDACELIAQGGGRGGHGAPGQRGGKGGTGGAGATGTTSNSCSGGAGGDGGDGGAGGGGAGGPSLGIAFVGTAPIQSNTTIQLAAEPAAGGRGWGGEGIGAQGFVGPIHAF